MLRRRAGAQTLARFWWDIRKPLSTRVLDGWGSEGGLLASEPFPPHLPSPKVGPVAAASACGELSLGHSGGPAPVSHRLPCPPIRGLFGGSVAHWRTDSFGASADGLFLHAVRRTVIVLSVTRSREPGGNPGLTRNGMGSEPRGSSCPSPSTRRVTPNIRTLFSRTDG